MSKSVPNCFLSIVKNKTAINNFQYLILEKLISVSKYQTFVPFLLLITFFLIKKAIVAATKRRAKTAEDAAKIIAIFPKTL